MRKLPSAKKLKTVEREASYVVVASLGKTFRLHRAGSYSCWMGRKRDFREATEFDAEPPTSRYTHVCKLCWPPKAGDDDSESGEASSTRCYVATWSWGGSGFGPHGDGVVEPETPQIDLRLESNAIRLHPGKDVRRQRSVCLARREKKR